MDNQIYERDALRDGIERDGGRDGNKQRIDDGRRSVLGKTTGAMESDRRMTAADACPTAARMAGRPGDETDGMR